MRDFRYFTLAVICFFSFGFVQGQTVVRGPYLQNPTQNSAVVCWRTDVPADSRVLFGTSPGNLNWVASDTTLVTNHFVTLQGLSPYTQYYYQTGTGTTLFPVTGDQYVRTFPADGVVQPVRIWALGDFGKGNQEQAAVRNAFEAFNADRKTDLWVWLGDNVYADGTDEEYQTKVFDSIYGYHHMMKYLPFHPCPGNHDYNSISPVTSTVNPNNHSGPYYDMIRVPQNGEVGGIPSQKPLYYSFDYANIHFISINSEIGSVYNASHDWIGASPLFSFNGSVFTQWLEQDLAANQQKWCIAYFHQPPYTDGSHESTAFWEVYMKAMRENIVPILENHGVDLVLNGHSHVYERSYLIKGLYDDDNTFNPATMVINGGSGSLSSPYYKYLQGPNPNTGTVYVVAGNGGSKEDGGAGLQHPVMFYGDGCDTCIGSFILDIHADTLKGRYLSASGAIKDEFYIIKSMQTGLAKPELSYFSIFPNPAHHKISISATANNVSKKWDMTLYDLGGKALFSQNNIPREIELSLEKYPSGAYWLIFRDESGQYFREKIIKE